MYVIYSVVKKYCLKFFAKTTLQSNKVTDYSFFVFNVNKEMYICFKAKQHDPISIKVIRVQNNVDFVCLYLLTIDVVYLKRRN